jgi:hypothetical protein
MAHFHTFIPTEPTFDDRMEKIENFTDNRVRIEFEKSYKKQFNKENFELGEKRNFWDTYKSTRFFLKENKEKFTIEQKRALLCLLYERDYIIKNIERWGYYAEKEDKRKIEKNKRKIQEGLGLKKLSVSLAEEAARVRKKAKNKPIKAMTVADLTNQQRKEIEAIEKLVKDINDEAESGNDIPKIFRDDWWKVANLDNFLKHKKKELEKMKLDNEKYRNSKKEKGEEEGYCKFM